jgi:hypothetical protein
MTEVSRMAAGEMSGVHEENMRVDGKGDNR